MYEITTGAFQSPRGRAVSMAYRNGTSDWNTLYSCLNEDEYRLAELTLSGTALDIGAHIGGASVALLVDNPDLHVIAVEAVPPNVELLERNLALNEVADRCTVIHAAAGKGGTAVVRWGFSGSESAEHHAYIGNSLLGPQSATTHTAERLPSRTLAQIVGDAEVAFAKTDCEGCEYDTLRGPALQRIALIRGEIHGIDGHHALELVEQLVPTHVYQQQSDTLPTGFEAVRRG